MKKVECPECKKKIKTCDECGEFFYPDEDLYCIYNGSRHVCCLDCVLTYARGKRVYGKEVK